MQLSDELFLTQLFNRRPKEKHTLAQIRGVLNRLGNPHENFPTIHVCGTNGKGQVCVKIARSLEHAGYKVGLFISPHLFEYEERISINQETISRKEVIAYDEQLLALMEQESLQLNFFESTFLYAMQYFSQQRVDVAVIEAGIGGRFDTTNVISPILTVITSIGLDHTEMLGESLDQIAWQKAGIIKEGIPVVIGPRAKLLPVLQEANDKKAPIFPVERRSCSFETENLATARQGLQCIQEHFPLSEESIQAGLSETLPCRFEKKGDVIYDVAHNPDGMGRLADALAHFYPSKTFRIVCGMSKDKDIQASLKAIESIASHFHFVQASKPNSASPQELGQALEAISTCSYSLESSITEAMSQAKNALAPKELMVVCGSFYIMNEAYKERH